jgi:hypothetical protein
MSQAVQRLGPHLGYLPDGETGARRNWVISMIETFRDHPDLQVAKEGDWSDYDKVPRFAIRPGHRLYGAAIGLGISEAAARALPEYEQQSAAVAAQAGHKPGFQIGIPGDIDLAIFTFGPAGLIRHLRPFTEALSSTMHATHALAPADVLFQIEIPAEVVLLARVPGPARPALAKILARRVVALAQASPPGARFGLHLCLGDMNHRAFGRIGDAQPLVLLANAIVAAWPDDRPLEYVHAPLAHADNPPTDAAGFYRPLAGLKLPSGARFIAGFAHEDQDAGTQRRIRSMIEDALGHQADISTSCGLGRREPAAALAAMDRIALLLAD